jgi:4-hydroxy-2-oxoheptanedioate aldolase
MDAGASIIVPQVETVEKARQIIAAAKFERKANGSRSAPPELFLPGITDRVIDPSLPFHQNLNRQAAVIIQIESLEAIHNLDAILTEVGDQIDSAWLGSLDARISMDVSSGGLDGDDGEWLKAKALYESTLRKHNKAASGLALGSHETKRAMARGRAFVVAAGDMFGLMETGLRDPAFARENYIKMDHS